MPATIRFDLKTKVKLNHRKFKRDIDKANRRSLFKTGAFIRSTARRSIKQSVKPSKPGHPPKHRKGSTFKNSIAFRVIRSESVKIGAANHAGKNAGIPVPELLEFGATITAQRAILIRRLGRQLPKYHRIRKGERMVYRPRPFMSEALKVAVQRDVVPKAFTNSLKV